MPDCPPVTSQSVNPDLCRRTMVSGVTTHRACFRPDQNLRPKTQKSLPNAASLGLGRLRSSAASCWRRAKFSRNRPTTSAEETNKRICQESDGLYYARVLSHFACGWERCILVKSKADRIVANDTTRDQSGTRREKSHRRRGHEFGPFRASSIYWTG